MPKKESDRRIRVSLWLERSDVEFIDGLFPGKRSEVIRKLVSAFVRGKRKEVDNVQFD